MGLRVREGQALALRFKVGFRFREDSRGTGPRATFQSRFCVGQTLALRFKVGFCFREDSRGTGPRATFQGRFCVGQALALRFDAASVTGDDRC